MKKIILVFLLSFLILNLVGCTSKKDYSKYSFVNTKWMRSTENDTEFISFSANGGFSYYCTCGNPVNDSDLCDSFSYNDKTKAIKLNCIEKTKETVTNIIIKEITDEELVLDFNGDIRVFTKEHETSKKDTITYEDKEYFLIEYNHDIFNYDLTVSVPYDEEMSYPINHDKWGIVYNDGDLFALESDIEELELYYSDDKNYNWWVRVENIDLETQYILDLSLSEDELKYIYNMENMEKDETIFFEEIEEFATLGKTSKDGLITATTELLFHNNKWYWRSEIIDEKTEGWPEYIFEIPKSLNDRITPPIN